MTKFAFGSELPFSIEELDYIEVEMKKYKVPTLYKIVFGSLYKWGKWFIPLLIFIGCALMALYTNWYNGPDFWPLIKWYFFSIIFGIGGLVLISFLWQRFKVLKECKRLNLKLWQWNFLTAAFQIKYM